MRTPSLAEIITAALDSRLEGMHVAIPGRVVKYYPKGASGTGTASADVSPAVKLPLRAGEMGGEVSYESLPVFPDVPIAWPSGGGYFVAFPLEPEDPVMLVFSDVAIGDYLSSGKESEPLDTRRHSLGYPVAIPGGARPDPDALADAPTDGAIIGKDGAETQIKLTGTDISLGKGSTDFVALATPTEARLDAIVAELNKVIVAVNGLVPGTAVSIAPPTSDVAATLVKAK